MPIETPRKSYTAALPKITRTIDTHSGSDAVKGSGAAYLPMLGGQTRDEYEAYLMRAFFMPAVRRTEKGLTGSIMRKDPVAELPESADFISTDIDGSGSPIDLHLRKMIEAIQTQGRVGLLVDWATNRPVISIYDRLSIINWSSNFVVLVEYHETSDPNDPYTVTSEKVLRELTFDDKGFYIQRIWKEEKGKFAVKETIIPDRQGERISTIPFFVANPLDNSWTDHDPLLMDLADVNLDHYRLASDNRHGLHFTALPTVFVFGSLGEDDEGNEIPLSVGPGRANIIPDTAGRAEMLEFTGAGLDAIRAEIQADESIMAAIGARLLSPPRKGVQAAETARIEQSSESASLTTVADSAENALRSALKAAVWWLGGDPKSVTLNINKDFIDATLSAQDLAALTQTWMAGGMSLESYLFNLKRGELLPDDRNIEDEAELIEDQSGDGPGLEG